MHALSRPNTRAREGVQSHETKLTNYAVNSSTNSETRLRYERPSLTLIHCS